MIMGFSRRPLAPGDVRDWVALLTAIQDADGSDEFPSEQDLREAFGRPDEDFPRGSLAIYDGPIMVGYGVLTSRSEAEPVHDMRYEGGVHPSYRGRGIGGELLDWAEKAAVPLHNDRHPGRPLSLSSGCLSSNAAAVALHEQRGYQPVRWFHSMVRDLTAAIPELVAPAGVRIVGYQPDMAEHARLISYEYEAYNAKTGYRDLHISLVGTRAAGRKRGIATALLTTAMSAARSDGYDQASLGVDADSLTGAVRLYEHVGFTVALTWTAFRKRLV